MLETIDVMRMATAMAQHAGYRQSATAENIAHADTPGYRAKDASPFSTEARTDFNAKQTRATHLAATDVTAFETQADESSPIAANGNSVSLEREMLRTVEIRQQHDTALAVYRSSLGILRTSLGRGR